MENDDRIKWVRFFYFSPVCVCMFVNDNKNFLIDDFHYALFMYVCVCVCVVHYLSNDLYLHYSIINVTNLLAARVFHFKRLHEESCYFCFPY